MCEDPAGPRQSRPSLRGRLIRRTALVTVLALLLAACGDDTEGGTALPADTSIATESATGDAERPSGEGWARDFCTTLGAGLAEIGPEYESRAEELRAELESRDLDIEADLLSADETDRVLAAEFLVEYSASLDDLVEGVEAAGVPDVEAGQEFVEAVVAGLSESSALIIGAVIALEDGDPLALPTEFEDLTFEALLTGRQFINLNFDAGSPELMRLLEDEAACEF